MSTGAVHKVRTCSSVHWSCTQGEDVFKCPLELYTGEDVFKCPPLESTVYTG